MFAIEHRIRYFYISLFTFVYIYTVLNSYYRATAKTY